MLKETALARAIEAGRQAGVNTDGATVVRIRSSTHVELPHADVLARVEPADRKSLAERQVKTAAIFASRGAPVSALVCPQIQPFIFDDAAVTLWQRLDGNPSNDPAELGQTVRALHTATRGHPAQGLPELDYLTEIGEWLEMPRRWLAELDWAELARRYHELKNWWDTEAANDPLGFLLVHGDVHRDNTIDTLNRGVILVDLEDAGVGPASWDLVPLAVGVRRYGDSPDDFRQFVDAYGIDPTLWPGFEKLCEIYELSVTIWATECSADSPEMAEEAERRLAGILDRSHEVWTLL